MSATSSTVLHFPVLSRADFVFFRLLGPGLGNLLFPLYRAFQGQRNEGGELVFPQFTQFKLGPWMRREADVRAYSGIFRLRDAPEVARHAKALLLSGMFRSADVQLYEGLGRHYHDLDPALRAAFTQLLMSRYRQPRVLHSSLRDVSRHDICVHVRRGDFQYATANTATQGTMNVRIEDDWYVQATAKARRLSPQAKIRVFTDAPQLPASLMSALRADELDSSPDALSSLLRMSAHGVVVASRSSFSLWAGFLGECRMVVDESFDMDRYMPPGAVETLRC